MDDKLKLTTLSNSSPTSNDIRKKEKNKESNMEVWYDLNCIHLYYTF